MIHNVICRTFYLFIHYSLIIILSQKIFLILKKNELKNLSIIPARKGLGDLVYVPRYYIISYSYLGIKHVDIFSEGT